jgi:hypothetical protein
MQATFLKDRTYESNLGYNVYSNSAAQKTVPVCSLEIGLSKSIRKVSSQPSAA